MNQPQIVSGQSVPGKDQSQPGERALDPGENQQVISCSNLSLGYDETLIIKQLNLDIPAGKFTVLAGPNGCGKSTLLRGIGRMLQPQNGEIKLAGTPIKQIAPKQYARKLAFLPQSPQVPAGLTVAELVFRGRYPYRTLFTPWNKTDQAAVAEALALTELTALKDTQVDSLSGGQRQRAWIALVLAQQSDVLLLDEPTTYLDLTFQIEVLDLLQKLVRETGKTIVVVLHELSLAARYAEHLILLKDGEIKAVGTSAEVLTEENLEKVFALKTQIITDPVAGTPLVVPEKSLKTNP